MLKLKQESPTKNSESEAGFTLIEMMVVVVIIILIVGFGGWNYTQYARRNGVEGAARELRAFLNEAKNNARYGRFGSNKTSQFGPNDVSGTIGVAGGTLNSYNPCYVGDVTLSKDDPIIATDPQIAHWGYESYLDLIGSSGVILENWGVYFDTADDVQTVLWMQTYCKYKDKWESTYHFPQVDSSRPPLSNTLREKTWEMQPGVKIYKPNRTEAAAGGSGVQDATAWGLEFTPLYLNVRYPLTNGEVNFGPTCYGEAKDEIVIGDVDGKYLYKMRVGAAGDVSKGCFCERGTGGLGCVYDAVEGPCSKCIDED